MERADDVQLIHAVLSGDDSAFKVLVEKYEKKVHAIAYGKIGDFQHAEDITQETFLSAYQKLSTLRNPSRFSGWLYVIAKRLCQNWLNKQKPALQLQSLEDTPMEEVVKSDYARYVSEQRETEATENRREIVNKLLEKLPEGERAVVTLHYLGEMTTTEISKFLGVSVEAIRTRLHRARKRLQEEEALLIQEVLGSLQIPARIKQKIMQEIANMQPTPAPKMKPLLPWVAFGTALGVTALLILGVGNLNLEHFQQLYKTYFASDEETTKGEKDFTPDFTLTLGTHRSGADLLAALAAEKCQVSLWSMQALENPDFPVAAAEITVDIVVVSMLELGFAEGEFATLDTIYARAKQMGLETCPVEIAPQLRLRLLDQPDWMTGDRLSEFFVASEPFVLTREGLPKIFSIVRDDRYPHPETGRGLWLIANGTLGAGDPELPGRLFSASDPTGFDHKGRFAFVIPK
ncbi:MAG: RNA polymerase sigma factor [Candidatus Poribacteria bacterium]|nr:RNA polymerase sigma factor [Candidatus Poribacteria bacterium]MDE0424561.1 RNA polymerase sigma factor [Candidatus Poribacteria bacterium]